MFTRQVRKKAQNVSDVDSCLPKSNSISSTPDILWLYAPDASRRTSLFNCSLNMQFMIAWLNKWEDTVRKDYLC